MFLIAYDGSADADAAIDHVATLAPGSEAVVVTVWETFVEALGHSGAFGANRLLEGTTVAADVDTAKREGAERLAAEGAARADRAGLSAESRALRRSAGIADALLETAEELGADTIVVGSRGRGVVRSLVLGSTSSALVHRGERPILVVPGPGDPR